MTIPPIVWALIVLAGLIAVFEVWRIFIPTSGTNTIGDGLSLAGLITYASDFDFIPIIGVQNAGLAALVLGLLTRWMRMRTKAPGALS